jgi:glycine oxidase
MFMDELHQVDYIIIGQGLAGSTVAAQLLLQKKKIVVVDRPDQNTSSRIAAGLFNPVTGRNLVKTWLADILFPYLHEFYTKIENETGERFFYSMPLYRPFASVEEQNEWMGKSADPEFKNYIEEIFTRGGAFPHVNDSVGGLILKQCGYLDTVRYINSVREWIKREGDFREEDFLEEELKIHSDGVIYKGLRAKRIIFCQGEKSTNNKWFKWVPIRLLKGEAIKIQAEASSELIINRGVYIVPSFEKNSFRVGATYYFQNLSRQISEEALVELEEKLRELVSFPYQVVSQEWGIRPTTPDRRPFLGRHPEFESLVIFNGLGTKGVSQAPYFSEVLIRWIEKEGPLNKEVDINRYK